MPYKNKADKNAQSRRWKKANRDKVYESGVRYREENKEQCLSSDRSYYHKNRDKFLLKQQNDRARRLEYLHEHLGHECVQCGNKERLEFDHINPALKTTRTPVQAMGKERADEEIPNLQILCHECHVAKSTAQKKAAWSLLTALPLEEQNELIAQFMLN